LANVICVCNKSGKHLYCALGMLILLLILCLATRAQRLPMRLYTIEDGLGSGFINHMIRDSHGFLWFCTRDGLSRFDGYRFTNYEITGGPASQNFTQIFQGRNGIFWIAIDDKQLYRWDPESGTADAQSLKADQLNHDGRVSLPAELVASQFYAQMFEDHNGNLWAGGAGLWRIEERAGKVYFHEINLNLPPNWKPSFAVWRLTEGGDGSLWLGTTHGLLRRLPDGRVVQYHLSSSPNSESIRWLLADKSGFIWANYPGGVYILRPEPLSALASAGDFTSRPIARSQTLDDPLPRRAGEATDLTHWEAFGRQAKEISAIYQQSNGQIWLVDKNRVVSFDGQRFHWFEDARETFGSVLEDGDGDLWITRRPGGVVRFSVQGLISYGPADGLGNYDIASIYEDNAARLHVVSSGWLVSRLEARKFKLVHANIPNANEMWSSPLGFLDHTGQWWFLTSRGVFRFAHTKQLEGLTHATPQVYKTLDGLPGHWAYCIFEDSRGDLWISIRDWQTGNSGLVQWRRADETFHRLTEADGLPPFKSAGSFAEDRAGNLWFGFYQGGLARYAAGHFTNFTPAGGLPEGFITALHLDRVGRLWLTSSGGGLARIDHPTAEHPSFFHLTTRDGLSSNNTRSLTEDGAGNIYVGTVRGLDRIMPETGKIRHYGLADGLAGDFVNTAYRDSNGSLWFGTFGGLSRLDPQPDPVLAAPPIRIEGLRIAGVKQPLSEFGASAIEGLQLSNTQSNLQIDFSSLSMSRAALLRYQYKLQGVDGDWSTPSDQRTVHYANLAPGTYRFLVRAVDPTGLSSSQPASVAFRIFPPFWQRWWFLALAITAVACAVSFLYRYRVAHLLELERVRTHIATDLHDDIGSSLSQIAVLSEVVRRQVEETASVSQPLSTIASTSRELVDSMSDIVWAINPNRDNFGDLAQRMRRFGSDIFTAKDIEFRFDLSEPERSIKLDTQVRRQVFLIFKECSHNIVRHSECSRVEVNLSIENHAITLTLRDDGKGFNLEQASHGHGLTSMNRRAKALDASFEISSRAGEGTVVSLKVPLFRHVALR
jgi:ligand-binding sensor domain-containing protein/two-component sensor histidine kinase